MEEPVVNNRYLLERYPGKGGWTYALLTDLPSHRKISFSRTRFKGHIDGFAVKNFGIMPVGDGSVFVPVKKEIRKSIQKEAGDHVHILLFIDTDPPEIPEDLLLCLQDNPAEYQTFLSYSNGEKKAFADWVAGAKTMETRVNRIAKTLDKLAKSKKFHDK